MDIREKLISSFWNFFDNGEIDSVFPLLHTKFIAIWKTTNETFKNRRAFIEVNKEYPGSWHTKIERIDLTENGAVSVVHVFSKEKDSQPEFYVTSFYEIKDDLISKLTEYWATCEKAPEWRKKYTA